MALRTLAAPLNSPREGQEEVSEERTTCLGGASYVLCPYRVSTSPWSPPSKLCPCTTPSWSSVGEKSEEELVSGRGELFAMRFPPAPVRVNPKQRTLVPQLLPSRRNSVSFAFSGS